MSRPPKNTNLTALQYSIFHACPYWRHRRLGVRVSSSLINLLYTSKYGEYGGDVVRRYQSAAVLDTRNCWPAGFGCKVTPKLVEKGDSWDTWSNLNMELKTNQRDVSFSVGDRDVELPSRYNDETGPQEWPSGVRWILRLLRPNLTLGVNVMPAWYHMKVFSHRLMQNRDAGRLNRL